MSYLKQRLIFYVFNVWIIITIAFLCVSLLPGDTARMVLGRYASEETLQSYRVAAGLDQPIPRQYLIFINRLAHLDLGQSLVFKRPVIILIKERILVTSSLVILALVLTAVFGILLPLFLKWLNNQYLIEICEKATLLLGIAPAYVLGVVALMVIGSYFGLVDIIFNPKNAWAWLLPSLVLASYPISIVYRLFGNQVDGILHSSYILRARAMGFSSARIYFLEVLPNALTEIFPVFANAVAIFITGSFFVEVIFGIPGLGRLTYEAMSNKDISLMTALCVLFAISVALVSALLELARYLADPRLREYHV